MIHHPPKGGRFLRWSQVSLAGFFVILLGIGPAWASYVIVLKNGRQIRAQNYQDTGDTIRLFVGGGQFSIKKDQVESISLSDTIRVTESPTVTEEPAPGEIPKEGKAVEQPSPGVDTGETAIQSQPPQPPQQPSQSPEEIKAEQRAQEEREYQVRVAEITNRIKSLMDQYALETRGTSGPDPTLLNTPAAIGARTADLQSRLKDARHNPAGSGDAGGITLETGGALSGRPDAVIRLQPGRAIRRVNPPLQPYSQKEKELSDLRKQINKLQNDRALLIQEMKQKNFNTSSLFLP